VLCCFRLYDDEGYDAQKSDYKRRIAELKKVVVVELVLFFVVELYCNVSEKGRPNNPNNT
jgi:hypothetical protein